MTAYIVANIFQIKEGMLVIIGPIRKDVVFKNIRNNVAKRTLTYIFVIIGPNFE